MTLSLNRRTLLQAGAAAVAAPYFWVPARADDGVWFTQTVGPFVEVETSAGRLRGGHDRGALAFKGIPYAGPASGKNRFKAPPKVTPWTGVRDATRLGPPAMQGPGTTYGEHEPAYSEDCLVLNVWTPAVNDGAKRPVMVYCHGGGFTTGSGGQRIQDGARLAATYDVVVVATNHRLGLLGYLYLGDLGGADYATSGNQGILDIIAALGWIKENIATFGGDPGNVMVFGESGGSAKTCAVMGMPAAQGLYHKAGMQSGPMLRGLPKEVATETARRVLAAFDIHPKDFAKLHDVPAQKFIDLQLAAEKGQGPLTVATKEWQAGHPPPKPSLAANRAPKPGGWGPVVDGTVLPHHPFDPAAPALVAGIPLLIGNMRDEAAFFERDHPEFFHMDAASLTARAQQAFGPDAERILATYRQTRPNATPVEQGIAIETALSMGAGTATLADRKAAQSAPVYRYRNDFQSNIPIKGTDWTLRAGHAIDISITFLNTEMPDLQGDGPGLVETAKAVSGYFTSFARSGVPSAAGQPAWPRYDTKDRAVMLLNSQCQVAMDPDGQEREMWQALGV
ncbi:carboxylesterase/lipase family protein [Nitrospirillum viridazoti]|uniref:Carboxylic ester hydrolase n=1 Tax=Nitrospirillum viridazoti CBAmc TaxID=1441467 RepID=A0A248JNP3_9PROT|nr:carboxylesterase family protein [Nitrospirillum amazonense]ASG20363.1 carboxylesterase [Nitrospirillum amazonense CBAmc]TWB34745.1 para-nitrobenzyl esterase [Nitrospirillum amazonense]